MVQGDAFDEVHDGGGRLITSGTGQLYVQTANIHNGTILYFRPNIPTTNNFHTGGARCTGNSDGSAAWIAFTAADQFPPGRVEIGRAANAGGAYVNLNGTSPVFFTVRQSVSFIDTETDSSRSKSCGHTARVASDGVSPRWISVRLPEYSELRTLHVE